MLRIPKSVLSVCCALSVGLVMTSCSSSGYETLVINFDDLETGVAPDGWTAAETSGVGKPGAWRVEKEGEGRCVRLAETENSGRTYNLLLAPDQHGPDLVVSVRLRADAGTEDQGGGLVWRAHDTDNYYVARWNPLEENLRAYTVIGGERTQFASADLKLGPGWHTLEVSMQGRQMIVSMDGKSYLDTLNSELLEGGMIGLWTKADAVTSFDELRIVQPDR